MKTKFKAIPAVTLVLVLLLSLAGCGNDTDIKVSEGSYIIGKQIKEAQYIITCDEDSRMGVIVFESEQSFKNYDNADRFTLGEENAAIEKYAFSNTYLRESESAFLSLKSGNVLVIESGNGMLEKISSDTHIQDSSVYTGVYVIGDDLKEGQYSFTCTDSGMSLAIFESKENYMNYFRSNRWTNDEEWEALEANASEAKYLREGDSDSINLKEGNVLMLSGGIGKFEVLE